MSLKINGISSTDPISVFVRVSEDCHRAVQLGITAKEYFALSQEDREQAVKVQLTEELLGVSQ